VGLCAPTHLFSPPPCGVRPHKIFFFFCDMRKKKNEEYVRGGGGGGGGVIIDKLETEYDKTESAR